MPKINCESLIQPIARQRQERPKNGRRLSVVVRYRCSDEWLYKGGKGTDDISMVRRTKIEYRRFRRTSEESLPERYGESQGIAGNRRRH